MQIIPNNINIRSANIKSAEFERTGLIDKGISSQSFGKILDDKIYENSGIQFSKHARGRLDSRDISFSNEQLERITNGIDRAFKKGINDSLVLCDDVALLINVKNKTVITAVDSKNNEQGIFTNIDGAVIV